MSFLCPNQQCPSTDQNSKHWPQPVTFPSSTTGLLRQKALITLCCLSNRCHTAISVKWDNRIRTCDLYIWTVYSESNYLINRNLWVVLKFDISATPTWFVWNHIIVFKIPVIITVLNIRSLLFINITAVVAAVFSYIPSWSSSSTLLTLQAPLSPSQQDSSHTSIHADT